MVAIRTARVKGNRLCRRQRMPMRGLTMSTLYSHSS